MARSDLILAGDIGGTNARFGCLERQGGGRWEVHHFAKLTGADFPSFEAALQSYLNDIGFTPRRAAFSAAGPVQDGYVKMTNTSWEISTQSVVDVHGLERCALYNDFAGMTRAVPELDDDGFTVLREGRARRGAPILVAGPGTGFGVGYLVPTAHGWHVMSTEGGHVAFTPRTEQELALANILHRDVDFVSVELVSSGMGLPVIHRAVSELHGVAYSPLEPDDIRARAEAGDAVCADVCAIRAAATMGAIGDLALSGGARGGIVLAGGVSARMKDYYMQPEAMARYYKRGPREDYMKEIPLRLLTCPMAALIGSAALLQEQLSR